MNDTDLIELLATRGMGWELHDVSAHRPGSRALPHVWRWRRAGGVRLMVYDGRANREWNPLAADADFNELVVALHSPRGITLPGDAMFDKRTACAAAAAALAPPPPPPDDPQPPTQEAPADEGV